MSRLAFWLRSSAADELAALLQLGGGFILPSRARQRQAKLIVRLAARRLQPRRLLQRGDRFGNLAVLQQRLAEREVGPRERRVELDHLLAAARSPSPVRALGLAP